MAREFKSLDAFATFLRGRGATAERAAQRALKREAQAVADSAKAMLGEYQTGEGPFPDWKQLADATQAERAKAGFAPNDPLRRTGDLAASISSAADGNRAVTGSTSPYAAAQELGTKNIPPRPFLGLAAHRRSKTVAANVANAAVAALAATNRAKKRVPQPGGDDE